MDTKQFFKSSLCVTVITFVGKALGFCREMMIAAKCGTGFISDLIVFIFSMDTIVFMAAAMALPNVIVPMVIECERERKSPYKAMTKVIVIVSILATILMGVGIIRPHFFIRLFSPGMFGSSNKSEIAMLASCIKLFLVSNYFVGISYVCVGYLQARKYFSIASGISIVYNAAIILGLDIVTKYTVDALLIVGIIVIAYFVQMLLALGMVAADFTKVKRGYLTGSLMIKPYLIMFIPIIISTSVQQLNYFFDKRIVSYCGQGELTLLHYGFKIGSFVYSLSTAVIAAILYPLIVRDFKDKNSKMEYERKAYDLSFFLFICFLWIGINSQFITDLLFGHGKFTEQNVYAVSGIMLGYLPGMYLMTIRDIYIKVSYANNNSRIPMIFAVVTVMINILLDYGFVAMLGTRGVAIATTCAIAITFIPMALAINRRYIHKSCIINNKRVIKVLVSFVLIYIAKVFSEESSLLFKLAVLATSLVISILICFVGEIREDFRIQKN